MCPLDTINFFSSTVLPSSCGIREHPLQLLPVLFFSFVNIFHFKMFYSLSQQKEKSKVGGDEEFPPTQATRQPSTAAARGHSPLPVPFGVNAHFPPLWTQCCPHSLPVQGEFTLPCSREFWHARSAGVTISLSDDELSYFFSFSPSNQVLAKHRAAREPNMENSHPRHA